MQHSYSYTSQYKVSNYSSLSTALGDLATSASSTSVVQPPNTAPPPPPPAPAAPAPVLATPHPLSPSFAFDYHSALDYSQMIPPMGSHLISGELPTSWGAPSSLSDDSWDQSGDSLQALDFLRDNLPEHSNDLSQLDVYYYYQTATDSTPTPESQISTSTPPSSGSTQPTPTSLGEPDTKGEAGNPPSGNIPSITGDSDLDELILSRYFVSRDFEGKSLDHISLGYELRGSDYDDAKAMEALRSQEGGEAKLRAFLSARENRTLPQEIPGWLHDVLGGAIIDLFTAQGLHQQSIRADKFGQAYTTETFLPHLLTMTAEGSQLIPLTWELLVRIELSASFRRGDTTLAITPNGDWVSIVSAEHLREIASDHPESIKQRMEFVASQPWSSPPYVMRGQVVNPRDHPRIIDWFHMMVMVRSATPPPPPPIPVQPVNTAVSTSSAPTAQRRRRRRRDDNDDPPVETRKRRRRNNEEGV